MGWRKVSISIGSFLLLSGLLWLSTFAFPREAKAGYGEVGEKFDYLWYVCSTFRSESGTNPYSEPECQELGLDYQTLTTGNFEWSIECDGPGCAVWYRNYVVPPVGVISYTLSCAMSGFVDDQGAGSGTFGHTANDSVSVHGDHEGTMGPGFVGLAFLQYWHVAYAVYGHDMGGNIHDPFFDWFDNGPSTTYEGWYVESTITSSGSQVHSLAAGDCYVSDWEGTYVPPTPTPAPTPTSGYPIWPSPVPFPTITATVTPVPPWPVDIGYTPSVTDTSCYVFIGSVPETATQWLDVFGIPHPEYDDIGVCVEPFDMSMSVGEWDVGRLAWLLASLGLVVGVWRMFTGG